MKILFLLLLASCASKPVAQRINDQLSYQELAPDTYVVTDEFYYRSNVLVARMKDGTVVIASSPVETKGTEALVAWIKTKLTPKKIIAINTHFHTDGTGGNAAFKKLGVETWSSELTRNLYLKTADVTRFEQAKSFKGELAKRIEERGIAPADNLFKARDGLLLNFGGESVEVIYPGPGHTRDNVAVFIPSRKVLFGGCMIRPNHIIGPLQDADIEQWDVSVEALLPLAPKFVIPGHGEVGDARYLHNTIKLVRNTRLKRY